MCVDRVIAGCHGPAMPRRRRASGWLLVVVMGLAGSTAAMPRKKEVTKRGQLSVVCATCGQRLTGNWKQVQKLIREREYKSAKDTILLITRTKQNRRSWNHVWNDIYRREDDSITADVTEQLKPQIASLLVRDRSENEKLINQPQKIIRDVFAKR